MTEGTHRFVYYALLQMHNEEKLAHGVVATPNPALYPTRAAYTRSDRAKKAMERVFATAADTAGAAGGRGRFVVPVGTLAVSPLLDRFPAMRSEVVRNAASSILTELGSEFFSGKGKPAPKAKLNAIVWLQELVYELHQGVPRS
jgi:hypothetical protein